MKRKEKLRVLVLFEMSGRVRDAFISKGHYAISVDLLDSMVPEREHIKADIYKLDLEFIKTFDLIVAFPPCTYFSQAGNRWFKTQPDRYYKLAESVDLVNYVWSLPVKYIAMENPATGRLKNYIPMTQKIQPYEFGENYAKSTGLWLKNLPPLMPTNIVKDYIKNWTQNNVSGSVKRSLTPYGLSDAMATQWGQFVLNDINAGIENE